MSMPGWYPDPAGGQGRFRYWDGSAWSQQTTTNPAEPVPGPSGPAGGQRQGGSWTWLLVVVAALAVIALVIWLVIGRGSGGGFAPVPEDTNSSTPTVSGWDETSKPTPPPTTQASSVACPITAVSDTTPQRNPGRLTGGGISVSKISGWDDSSMYLDWVSDVHVQVDEVRPGWISNIGVGQLNAQDGFTDVQTGARQTMECFSTSGYYTGYTHRVDVANEAITVDGHAAWWMRAEVHIQSDSMPEIQGDVVDVIVIDLGDPERMGMFFSSVTIGDERRQALVDESITTIQVD